MTGTSAAPRAPAQGLPPRAGMLVLSTCGMAIGLAVDCRITPPELLAALCTASGASLAATLAFHTSMMPASYAMMTGAAILAAAFAASAPAGDADRRLGARVAKDAVSVVLMLAGMFAGGWLVPEITAAIGVATGFGAIVAGMTGGMVAAALAAGTIARLVHAAGAREDRRRSQYIMYQ